MNIEYADYGREFCEVVEHRQQGRNVSQVAPAVWRNHRNLPDRLARHQRSIRATHCVFFNAAWR
jgi:hypothetical protein